MVLKKLTQPFQLILLKRRLCVGCTYSLDKCKRNPFRNNKVIVTCKCGRRYVLNLDTNTYQRASHEENAEYLNKVLENK